MRAEAALAWRLLGRQWKAGDLRLMAAAAVLSVAITTLIAAFGDRLERGLLHRAADLLGADLVLTGSTPPTPQALAAAGRDGLAVSRSVDFSTMLASGEDVLLAQVRAADDAYPLRGELVVDDGGERRAARPGPRPGELWIDTQVRDELRVGVGDTVEVGHARLRITAVLLDEPERGGGFVSGFGARVLMHRDDLDASGVVQPGSRVRYRTLMAGDERALARAHDTLETLKSPHEELVDVRTGSRRTASALGRTTQFLSLAAVLGVILCGTAIGIAADRQSRRLYDTVALLRTFGFPRHRVARVLALEVVILALVAGLAGTALGLLASELLAALLADALPANLPRPGASVWLTGLAAAAITLPAFALPPLLRLGNVPPLRVLRRDLDPPARTTLLQYGAGLSVLAMLVVLVAADRALAVAMLGATVALFVATVPLAAGLLRLLRRARPRLPFALRLAADRLSHAPVRFGAQLVAFALILSTMALATLLRGDLLANWQRQLPADAPNVFAMNLLPHEREDFLSALQARGIAEPPLYPVTPGRLIRIDGVPAADRIPPGSDAERSLDRDLILTQSAQPGADNRITAGEWWPADAPPGLVSVEAELGERLGLAPGDTLTFLVAGQMIETRVANLRTVDWDSFRPNFFMVFSPGTLTDAPYTWLTSFRDPGDSSRATVRALRADFPALTMIEVGPLLERMNRLVGQMASGIGFVLALLLVAALLLLAATVVAGLDERLAESALLRVLGARRRLLRASLLGEFALLGLVAGLLAAATTELARALLYTRVLELDWQPLAALWLALPPASALLLALTGYLAARHSLSADAGNVLKEA